MRDAVRPVAASGPTRATSGVSLPAVVERPRQQPAPAGAH
jgi:hypothetical protein